MAANDTRKLVLIHGKNSAWVLSVCAYVCVCVCVRVCVCVWSRCEMAANDARKLVLIHGKNSACVLSVYVCICLSARVCALVSSRLFFGIGSMEMSPSVCACVYVCVRVCESVWMFACAHQRSRERVCK